MYDRLYSVGRRILRDGNAAEDAVQEALIRGWRDLRSLREPDRFEAWMHRLLVRACQDQVRRRRALVVRTVVLDIDPSDRVDDYAGVILRDELERAFLQLPVEHRAVLVLIHYVGLPAPEVARILEIPPGTVYSRLHYGGRRLRAALLAAPSEVPTMAPQDSADEQRQDG